MSPRPLTKFEMPIAGAIIDLGHLRQWEFAAYLKTPEGPLVEMRCLMRDDRADPSQDVHIAAIGNRIVVHHNHLSQESLSLADWNGLATIFDETFAHCEDGTRYWGRVLNRPCVEKIFHCSAESVEMNAENVLFQILTAIPQASSPAGLAHFFRKEVVNRAMRLRGFVDYEYSWGTQHVIPYSRSGTPIPLGPAGILGNNFQSHIDQAAGVLAPAL